MDELLVKIGQMLDEKIEKQIGKMLDEKLDAKLQDLSNSFDAKLQNLSDIFDSKLQALSDTFDGKIEELRKDMLDQFFLFECEYGDRIIAIGDSALLDNQKNVERSQKMHELEERMNRNEIKINVCQNDIFKLKQKVK